MRIVQSFLGLVLDMLYRIPIGTELCSLNKPVDVLCQRQNPGRVWRMSLDAALLDEALPTETVKVTLHSRAVGAVCKPCEVVCGDHAELAKVGECLDLRFPQGILAVAAALDHAEAVIPGARFH